MRLSKVVVITLEKSWKGTVFFFMVVICLVKVLSGSECVWVVNVEEMV